MKTEFEVLVVLRGGRKPLERFYLQGELSDVLIEATKKMRSLGARVAEARNLPKFRGSPSLLLSSPGFPLGVVISGAQLTDAEGIPLKGEEATTGLSALISSIIE
jgi:hypothetical protein